ncbi:MAG: dipeptidase [Emcibacter sp.]|nr:dipeptidase [Emcibacter sp.]
MEIEKFNKIYKLNIGVVRILGRISGRIFSKISQRILAVLLIGIFGLAGCSENPIGDSAALAIHDHILTIDSHVDISSDYTYLPAFDPGKMTDMKVDLPKMKAGGLDAAFFVVYVGQTARTEENYAAAQKDAIRKFKAIHRMTDDLYADQIGLALGPEDVRRIHKEGRKVAIISIENGYVIGKNITLVEAYYNRGARYMTLAHNGHNDICDSAQPKEKLGDDKAEHGGVSPYGRQVIAEMNRVGMMVDISHVSRDCMIQAVTMSKAPAIASHSGVRALADHPRNLDDAQMKFLAEKGGVMQLVAYTGFVKIDPARNAALDLLTKKVAAHYGLAEDDYENLEKTEDWSRGQAKIDQKFPIATVKEFVDHIDYAVKVIGIDHVGISSDFDGGGGITGWNDASESLNITRELVERGYSEQDIAKIWGGNLLRVWAVVDQVAAKLSVE